MTTLSAPIAKATHRGRPRFLAVAALLWLAPVLATVAEVGETSIFAFTTLAAALCAVALLWRPRRALVALPFFALLSPMTGLLDVGGAQLVYSDLLFLLLTAQAAVAVVPRLHKAMPARHAGLLAGLAAWYIVSMLLGLAQGYLISAKPVLYALQLAIVYVYTRAYVRTPEDWLEIVRAWLLAAAYASLILLQAYAAGRNLDTLKEADMAPAVSPDDLLALFRATYYYSGVHYILGLGIVWQVVRLFFPEPLHRKTVRAASLAALVLALTAMVNKTAMGAVALAIVITGMALFVRFRREMMKSVLWMAAICVVGGGMLGWQYYQLSQNTQLDLIVDRLGSSGSLLIRFEVYAQAMDVWSSTPTAITAGFGPDFLDNSGNPQYAAPLKTSKETGYEEGTVDSAWLSYLIELGVPGAVLLALLFGHGLSGALAGIRAPGRFDDRVYANATVLGGLAFLAIAMTTQMLGYSKTSWLPFQLLFVSLAPPFAPAARRHALRPQPQTHR